MLVPDPSGFGEEKRSITEVQHPDAGGTERKPVRKQPAVQRTNPSHTPPHKHTTVVASYTDHILVVIREADVGHMSRMTEVTFVFGKFL